jgi:fructose-specific phosphotransferase system IIC component
MTLPTSFYTLVGTLIVANIGTIIAVFVFIFKAGIFVAETKSGIKDAKDSSIRAHKRIDKIETKGAV